MKSADMDCGPVVPRFWKRSLECLVCRLFTGNWFRFRDQKKKYSTLEKIVNDEIPWRKLTQSTFKLMRY